MEDDRLLLLATNGDSVRTTEWFSARVFRFPEGLKSSDSSDSPARVGRPCLHPNLNRSHAQPTFCEWRRNFSESIAFTVTIVWPLFGCVYRRI